jgi:excisionase family DNA binding protein
MDAAEAARLLDIGKSLFYALLAREGFGPKPLRLGRAVRFSRIEVEAWIAGGCPPRARWEATAKGGRRT